MPTGTKVERVYQALRREGADKGKAARIAQWQTGKALATGRKPKHSVKTANEPEPKPGKAFQPGSYFRMGGRPGKVVEKHPDGVTVRWAGGEYERIPIVSKVAEPGIGMADDESEVEFSPGKPSYVGQVVRKVLNSLRKEKDKPTNAGVAVGYEKLMTPGDGLNVKARQPVDPNKPPRASGGTRTPPPPWWEPIPGEHPALVRKKSDPSEEYLMTIQHPDLPKETEEYTHGIGGPKLTPEEVEELAAHFLAGGKATKPHLNSQGKPTTAEERYPRGVHKITRGFYRVGYNPAKLMEDVNHRRISLRNIHLIAPYTSEHVKHPEKIQWVDTQPEGKEIGTSNKPHSRSKMKKTVHQRIMELCHSPIEETALSNDENKEVALAGNRRRAWRNYSYRKLALPKLGLADENEESDEHEDLKKYNPHQLAAMALQEPDYDTSLEYLKLAGKIAESMGEVGMSATPMPEPGAPAAPSAAKAPSTPSLGKTASSVGRNVGSQALKSVTQYGADKAKNAGAAIGINFSNDIGMSNTPSSHRITRSPGNQILFRLRQKKDQ